MARHIPTVWRTTTPEAAIAARQAGCVQALRRILGDRVDTPAFAERDAGTRHDGGLTTEERRELTERQGRQAVAQDHHR